MRIIRINANIYHTFIMFCLPLKKLIVLPILVRPDVGGATGQREAKQAHRKTQRAPPGRGFKRRRRDEILPFRMKLKRLEKCGKMYKMGGRSYKIKNLLKNVPQEFEEPPCEHPAKAMCIAAVKGLVPSPIPPW